MSAPDISKLKSTVESLINSTVHGGIDWSRINPTTYVWNNQGGRVILQQIGKNTRTAAGIREIKSYLLQVMDQSGDLQLSVSSDSTREAEDSLARLYGSITTAMTNRGLDFLSSLIPPAK